MTIRASLISATWGDGSTDAQQTYQLAWRCVSTVALNQYSSTDIASLRDATCGTPLSALPGTLWNKSSLMGTLRLRNYKIAPVKDSDNKIWDVAAQYSSEYFWAKISPGGGTDKLMLPIEVSMEAGERMVQAWRTSSSIAGFGTAPSYSWGKSYDIGGDKIDDAGKPTTVRVPTMDVRISIMHDIADTATGTLVTVYDKINTVQGKWNSATFLHWGVYEVFCTSATVAKVRDEIYRVTYNFRWDYWYDCSQIPEMDPDGHPKNDGAGRAKNVFWTGLKRGTADHNVIFNTTPDATLAKQIAKEGCHLTYP